MWRHFVHFDCDCVYSYTRYCALILQRHIGNQYWLPNCHPYINKNGSFPIIDHIDIGLGHNRHWRSILSSISNGNGSWIFTLSSRFLFIYLITFIRQESIDVHCAPVIVYKSTFFLHYVCVLCPILLLFELLFLWRIAGP